MFVLIFSILLLKLVSGGILYPRPSETREILSLDGLWNFAADNSTDEAYNWYIKNNTSKLHWWYKNNFKSLEKLDLQLMPVPASYNDLGTDSQLRDHVGPVWYQRKFYVPKAWSGEKVWIRFSSICRTAEVWINDKWVVSHNIGHLPFQAEISSLLNYGTENSIVVSVDSTLTQTSIPQGSVNSLISGRMKQSYTFDFFNYGGIDRPVVLYTTPATYVDDVTITSNINGSDGFVNYLVSVIGSDVVTAKVSLFDKTGTEIVSDSVLNGTLRVQNATFWWPYLMDANPGYLYSLDIKLFDAFGNLLDRYYQPVGIRTITWDSTSVKINNKSVYLRGFGRHEDSDFRGKGLDLSVIIRDHNLLKWIGANSYRTSHYPYAEEIMDLADELGIMIIDESPAVNTENFSDELLENHKQSLTELIQRDKNRPSVIMWSAANEPRTQHPESENYYKEVVAHIKSLDTTRPVTVVNNQEADVEFSAQFIDVASCNVYHGWYDSTGDIDVIIPETLASVRRWHTMHNIPVLVTEYGADTIPGLHNIPSVVWTEEFQDDFMSKHFEAFDQMREEGFLIGEMIWNFADFQTAQTTGRVRGNKKGVFTRNRQPKASASLLRRRYWTLAQNLDGTEVPDDLNDYIFSKPTTRHEL